MSEAVPVHGERAPPIAAPRSAAVESDGTHGAATTRPRWCGDTGLWRRPPSRSQAIDHARIHPAWGTAL